MFDPEVDFDGDLFIQTSTGNNYVISIPSGKHLVSQEFPLAPHLPFSSPRSLKYIILFD